MALRFFYKNCEIHGLYPVRRPVRALNNSSIRVEVVIAEAFCHQCHPERLDEVCGGCLLPWTVVKQHSHGLCNTCVVRAWRDTRSASVKVQPQVKGVERRMPTKREL